MRAFPRSGGIAQLVERFVRNEEARGSNPLTSTTLGIRTRHPISLNSWVALDQIIAAQLAREPEHDCLVAEPGAVVGEAVEMPAGRGHLQRVVGGLENAGRAFESARRAESRPHASAISA